LDTNSYYTHTMAELEFGARLAWRNTLDCIGRTHWKRLTVIDVSFKKKPEEKLVLINPEIIEREGKQLEEEGCLSLPEIREKVQRAAKVKVRAQDVTGKWFEVEGEELLARALQHEIDHLDGILFIDRLSRLKRDLVIRKIKKLQKNGEW